MIKNHANTVEITREDVEKLKADWALDPCWDIEDTEGFEAFREELQAFSEQSQRVWAAEELATLNKYAEHHGVSVEVAKEMQILELSVRRNIESSSASLGRWLDRAGVAHEVGELEHFVETIVNAASAKVRFQLLEAGSRSTRQEVNRA